MRERMAFWIGLALSLLGLGMPIAVPDANPAIGFVLLALAGLCGLWLAYLIAEHRGWLRMPLRSRAIAWTFDKTGEAVQLEWSLASLGAPLQFFVPGFVFSGTNVSEQPVYRPDAFVTVEHSGKVVPLFIAAEGQWIEFSAAKEIPAGAPFQIGCQMRGDALHCAEWTERMSPEQFLREVGGFKLTFSADGLPTRVWHFTTEQLRRQFERQKRKAEEHVRERFPPSVKRL